MLLIDIIPQLNVFIKQKSLIMYLINSHNIVIYLIDQLLPIFNYKITCHFLK